MRVREHSPVTEPFCLLDDCLTVLCRCVQVRDRLNGTSPDDVPIPYEEVKNSCRTSYGYPSAGAVHSLSTLALLLTLAFQALVTLTAS